LSREFCHFGVRELAPAFTREATSRIAQTPFFRGSELQFILNAVKGSDKNLRRAAPSFRGAVPASSRIRCDSPAAGRES